MDENRITLSQNKRSMMANVINLMFLACIDGNVSEEEEKLVKDIAHAYGLTEEEYDYCSEQCNKSLKDGKAVIEVPEDDNDKIVFLRNLVMGMMCDGKIDEAEMSFIQFIAERYGFKPKEIVEYLMNSITEEFGGKGKEKDENAESNEEIDEEALKQEIAKGKEALVNHDIKTAFDHLFYPAHLDRDALNLYMRIPYNEHWIRLISDEQVELLKTYVEKGDVLSQFTLGRYHQVVTASYDEASDLFVAAGKVGLADAAAALSIMYRLGQLGEIEIDKEKYLASLSDAFEKGSELACYQMFKAQTLGHDGMEAKPQDVIDCIKNWLNGDESEDIQKVNPMFYEILGLAYQVLDDWETSADYYAKSVRMGRVECYPDYLILTSYNHDFELIDKDGYYKGIETGCQLGIAYCYYMRATLNKDRYDETEDAKEQEALHTVIAEDLNTASQLGDGNATLQLGYYNYYGEYGFEENDKEAWIEFIDATTMNMADAWSMLAQIVLDGNSPEDKLPANFVPYCRLMALRLGDDEQLIPVILAYHSRALGKYKNEITKYYIPQYDALPDEVKVTYFGLSFIALIKPTGKADLIEFDFEKETWEELCEVIDAKQMDPIRSGALKQIAKDLELEDNITAWVDSEAQAKGLEENPTGDKIYPGVLGHVILTLEDEDGNQHCFSDIYELEDIIEQLGCEVENIYYEEFPDNDERWDPHA